MLISGNWLDEQFGIALVSLLASDVERRSPMMHMIEPRRTARRFSGLTASVTGFAGAVTPTAC
jgi:hypothetical protein